MPTTTRGPLPAAVYWRRRLLLLSVALLLVVGFGKVLGAGSDGSSQEDGAAPVAAQASTPAASSPPASQPTKKGGKGRGRPSPPPTTEPAPPPPPPLAEPTGECVDSDIVVTPVIGAAVADSLVTITLNFQTLVTEACTWEVSPDTVTMKITSGVDDVWSSRECPAAIPTQSLVVRRVVATPVAVVWNTKRSDEDCTSRTAWALPGSYQVLAAVLSGEPTDVQFELTSPVAPTVTVTPSPTQAPDAAGGGGNGGGDGGGNGGRNAGGNAEPSGAVEPNG